MTGGIGIASCMLGCAGEVMGDKKTGGVSGRCEPDGMPPVPEPSNPSIQPRK
jgi:hypothetical protein